MILLLRGDKIITLDALDEKEKKQLRELLGDMLISEEEVPCG